jgi:hypothetical protein
VSRVLRFVPFALLAGVLAAVAFSVAFFGGRDFTRDSPTAPWFALLLLLSIPLLARVGRGVFGDRAFAAAALTMGALAVTILLGAKHALEEPLIYAHPPTCGTGRVMFEMSIPPWMFAAGMTSALLAAGAVARRRAGLRYVVLALASLSALLVTESLLRLRLPEASGYLPSLPVVTRVAVNSGTRVARVADPSRSRQNHPGEATPEMVSVYDDIVGEVMLRRNCVDHNCSVGLVHPGTPSEVLDKSASVYALDEDRVVVRHDALRGTWFLGTKWGDGAYRYVGPEWPIVLMDLRAGDLAGAVRPPRGWIVGAALGLLLAGGAWVVRKRVVSVRAAIAAGREGVLDASGVVSFTGDDPPLRVASGQACDTGPVVVLPAPVAPGGVYRGDGRYVGAQVTSGRQADLLAASDNKVLALEALALASIALTVAPLVASAIVGILP